MPLTAMAVMDTTMAMAITMVTMVDMAMATGAMAMATGDMAMATGDMATATGATSIRYPGGDKLYPYDFCWTRNRIHQLPTSRDIWLNLCIRILFE
uniref:Uncharacterized protein n=1 Tax=Pectinaria gouldii TaxID=260746 RepID=Q6R7S2_PECGU|nr:hypothetical protein [Pectinaria gouldii]